MKHHLLPLALIASLGATAQTQVSGVLVDSLNRSGEPYATVRLLSPKGNLLTTFLTDENGKFSKILNGKGPHVLTFSAVGRNTVVRPIELGAPTLKLDTLLISSVENLLGAATVVAQKPLVKMETDKVTYDTENDADAKNFTLLDMLRKVPLVMVDGQDNITVNGSGNFLVYVDGKPNPMFQSNPSQVLKSIPASYVKKIEVITNPGARFDAEGVGGVINLVTQASENGEKATMDGYSGNIGARITPKNGVQTDAFLSVQRKKWTFALNATHSAQIIKDIDVLMERAITATTPASSTTMKVNTTQRQYYSSFAGSAAYQLNKSDLFSLSVGLSRWAEREGAVSNTTLNDGLTAPLTYRYDAINRKNHWNGYVALDYQHSSKAVKGRLFTISYRLNFSPDNDYSETLFDGTNSTLLDLRNRYSDIDNRSTTHTGQIDYTTPFAKIHKLSFGTKFIARTNHAQTDYFLDNGAGSFAYNASGSSDYKEYSRIGALYAEYESTIKAFTFKAGLRYEHTWLEEKFLLGASQDFKANYGNLVPNATISWAFRQGQNLGLSYSQRISRPDMDYMNPALDQSSPITQRFGNASLDAERHNKLSLVYNFFSPKVYFNLQLSHNFTDNGISEYSYMNGAVQTATYGNINSSRSEHLSLFININATKTTRIYSNLGGGYTDCRSDVLPYRNHGWTGNAMLGMQQDLPWRLKFSASLFANSPQYGLQSRSGSFVGGYVALNRPFFKDKLDVGTFFFMPAGGKIRQNNLSWGDGFVQTHRVAIPLRILGVSLRYNFGNRKIRVPKVERSIENDGAKNKGGGGFIPGMEM